MSTGELKSTDEHRCPKCGGETTFGYGLAGGGMGYYEMCLEEGCDYFHKEQDKHGKGEEGDEEAEG